MVEAIGQELYRALSQKTRQGELKAAYGELAELEKTMAAHIEQEFLLLYGKSCLSSKSIIARCSHIVFSLLSEKQLLEILRRALKKRAYSRWSGMYRERNCRLWDMLTEHETTQHTLLGSLLTN